MECPQTKNIYKKIKNKANMPIFTTPILHYTGSLSQCNILKTQQNKEFQQPVLAEGKGGCQGKGK